MLPLVCALVGCSNPPPSNIEGIEGTTLIDDSQELTSTTQDNDGTGSVDTSDGSGTTFVDPLPSHSSSSFSSSVPSSGSESSSVTASTDSTESSHSSSNTSAPSSSGDASGTTTTDITQDNCPDVVTVRATIRDFSITGSTRHPDFEHFGGSQPTKGLVQSTLGPDHKPRIVEPITENQLTSAANFDQWYNDVEGVNHRFTVGLDFTQEAPGRYKFENTAFFPLGPDQGWGKENLDKNYGFTTEILIRFEYQLGQTFKFTGDDDLWMFIDDDLVLDLGGLHPPASEELDLDAVGQQLGLIPGHQYDMRFFHAERHSTGSNFIVNTNIGCPILPG